MTVDPVAIAHDGVGYGALLMAHEGLLEVEFEPPLVISGGRSIFPIPRPLRVGIAHEQIDEDDVLLILATLWSKRLR